MSLLSPTGRTLVELMVAAPRGPRRDGLFALWLTVRVIEDLGDRRITAERATRRRILNLERRLSSLALVPPLRRGLAGTMAAMAEPDRANPAQLLTLLAAPAREALGAETGDLLQRAARALKP